MSIKIQQETCMCDMNGKFVSCSSIRSYYPSVTMENFKSYVDEFVQLNNKIIVRKDEISKFYDGSLCCCIYFDGNVSPQIPTNKDFKIQIT